MSNKSYSKIELNLIRLEGIIASSSKDPIRDQQSFQVSASCSFSGSPSDSMEVGASTLCPSNSKLAVQSESLEINSALTSTPRGGYSVVWPDKKESHPHVHKKETKEGPTAHLSFHTSSSSNQQPELLEIYVHLQADRGETGTSDEDPTSIGNVVSKDADFVSNHHDQQRHLWHGVAYMLVYVEDLRGCAMTLRLPVKRPSYFARYLTKLKPPQEAVYLAEQAYVTLELKLVEEGLPCPLKESTSIVSQTTSATKDSPHETVLVERIQKNEEEAFRYFQKSSARPKMAPLTRFICVHPDDEILHQRHQEACNLGESFENLKRVVTNAFVFLCTGVQAGKQSPRKRSTTSTISTKSSATLSA